MTAAARGWVAGVTAGSIVYAAVAWVTVIRWRAGVEAAGPQGLAGPALARAVAFDMLPFSDRVRRRGAQAERDRLASARGAPRMPSSRELQVISMVALGSSNAEIGAALGIDERTVESHLRRLSDRYGADSRTELSTYSVRQGWIDLGATEPGAP